MMKHILFVCAGNTCRSPMAEGLARHLLGQQVYVESAGLRAGRGGEATRTAVDVLRERYGIDLSAHRSRPVDDLPVDMFDMIVALNSDIDQDFSERYPRLRERMVAWNVDDPFGQDAGCYTRTAAEIEQEIRALAERLGLTLLH